MVIDLANTQDQAQSKTPKATIISGLGNAYITDIMPQSNHDVWFASYQGLLVYNSQTKTVKKHQAYNQAGHQVQKRRLSRLLKDRHGVVWVGTQGAGLNLYVPPASKVGQLSDQSTTPFALINNDVWAIHEDDKAYIVATNAGVQFYDKNSGKAVVLDLVKETLINPSDEVIYSIRAYGDDYLLGGEDGLFLLNYKTSETLKLVETATVPDSAEQNNLPISGSQSALQAQPMPGFPAQDVRILDIEVTPKTLYVGGDLGVYKISRVDDKHELLGKAQGLDNVEIKDIEIDEQGNLWLGTRQGVSVLAAGSDSFIHFLQSGKDEVLANEVSKLLLLEPGVMLVSFYNRGVFAIDHRQGFDQAKVLDMNRFYGITYKNIFTMVRANNEHLLLGTDQGLYKINTTANNAKLYSKNDGLPSAEFNEGAAFCAAKWGCSLGSSAGVLKIQVDDLRHRVSDIRVMASELKVHVRGGLSQWSLRPESQITVSPDHTGIFVKFTTLNYLDSHNTRFKYRLLPTQTRFTDLSHSGELFLSNLPAGEYELEVRGTSHNIWMKDSYSLKMQLLSHWWQTTEARMALAVTLLLFAAWLIYNRMRYIKRIKGYNEELTQGQHTLQLALWGSDAGSWQWNSSENQVTINETSASLMTPGGAKFDGVQWLSRVEPQRKKAILSHWHQYIATPQGSYKDEYKIKQGDEWRWITISGKVVSTDKDGKAEKIVGTFADITEQKSLEQQSSLFGQAFESASEGIIILDESIICRGVNAAAERLTGFSRADLMGASVKTLLVEGFENDGNGYKEIFALVKSDGNWQGETQLKTRQLRNCPIWLNITEMDRDEGEKHYLMLATDLSESKRADRALRQLTNFDVLTGLANRKLFEEHLLFSIEHAKSSHERLALLFIDLVRFKAVNDRFGHNIGDVVLHEAGHRMQAVLNKDDVVARFGGDKFVVLLAAESSANNPNSCCCDLMAAFDEQINVDGKRLQLSVTIGISVWPDDDVNGDQLIKHAEMAMYHAKESGGSTFEYFSVGRQQQELSRLKMEHELAEALEKKQFTLFYQPQVDATNNKIIGVEALIRWFHPTEGMISPDQFIPMAEANGLIIPISNWVLETAIQTALAWQTQLDEPIKMAVNISGLHFNEATFASGIIALLEKYQFAPDNLCLEITEGMLISDIKKPLADLKILRELGVQVAIDDFGTGYSSLAYLKKFPVTCLKIDKSFVLNLANDKEDQAIVNSVVSLGHFLGFEVLAEGVERLEDYHLLQQIGCDQVQGYYFAKPLPADEALAFVQDFWFK
ncbi:MAG: diguanylate cyclase (GGDEF)-like protein/PAS domain S-box-containing protein [Phenylobacterium sp.]